MDLSDRRDAASGADGRRRRLAESRHAALLKTSELELPISMHGDDADAIAREKANLVAEKVASHSRKTSRSKTPMRASTLVLGDEDMTEGEGLEKEQNVASDDVGAAQPTAPAKPSLGKETESRPQKRVRSSDDPDVITVEETSTEADTKLASWLHEGFEMPSDEDGIFEISEEIASVPALMGFDLHSRDSNYSLIGAGIVQRASDKKAIEEIEEQDADLSLNFAGLQICGITGTLYGLRNKCNNLSFDLEKSEKSRKRALGEKEKYKKKCLELEKDLAELQAGKSKVDEALKTSENIEQELRGEITALKLGSEEKIKKLEAENLEKAALNAQLLKEISDIKAKAEEEAMDLYDKALLHAMRAAVASSNEIPAITPELVAKWGSEPIFSDLCRQGHSLVPYEENELLALAAEDKLLGKQVWEVPPVATNDALTLWVDLIDEKGKALKAAKDAARAAKAASSGKQTTAP